MKIHEIVSHYHNEAKANARAMKDAEKNYTGDMLTNTIKNLRDLTVAEKVKAQDAVRDAIESLRAGKLDAIAGDLSSAASMEDFRLLQLPVKLTPVEVEVLAGRSGKNPLFARALEQYCEKNNIPLTASMSTGESTRAIDELGNMALEAIGLKDDFAICFHLQSIEKMESSL